MYPKIMFAVQRFDCWVEFMTTPKRFMVSEEPVYEFLCKKMVLFLTSFCFSVTTFMFTLFRILTRYLFGFLVDDTSPKKISGACDVLPLEDDQFVPDCMGVEKIPELEVVDHGDAENDGVFGEKESTPEFTFKFEFPKYEDTRRNCSGDLTASTSKYEVSPNTYFSGFMEEPAGSFVVKEMFSNSNQDSSDVEEIFDDGFLSEKFFLENKVHCEETMNKSCSSEDSEQAESVVLTEVPLSDSNSLGKEELGDEARFISENELVSSDSEPESINLWDKFSVMVDRMDSGSEGFLSDGDFDGAAVPESVTQVEEDFNGAAVPESVTRVDQSYTEQIVAFQNSEEKPLENQQMMEQRGVGISSPASPIQTPQGHDEPTDMDDVLEMIGDIEKLEELNLPNLTTSEADAQIERELEKIQAECELEDLASERNKAVDNIGTPEGPNLPDSSSEDYEDSSNLETLWEHQDLIEQLKMEIRKVRATGLPTILEESESPRMSEDLKPWKIDEKVVHKDQIDGLHKFYNRYNERMRKFDILNYQKMYAIGFLKLKDPLQVISTQKSSGPTLTSLLSQNILLPKRRKPEEDASVTFLRELESDLEQVYVGQLCLSWEFLHWQQGKARELLESDPYEVRPYNHVAGEFQQFQVLLQRFVENEPFQGPRVQSYIKNRCVLRNLLQVPLIREDPVDKEGRKRSKDAITCSMLLDIIEESMRIFWEFVRADKCDASVILKGSKPQVKFADPVDADLFMEVQTDLQKKEKKLKDILRSGNCLVKKFQKQHKEKEQSDELLLFSQIDLKLVSRVLRMSRLTTAELTWCQRKLSGISFVQRKIHVENSFLLFPC